MLKYKKYLKVFILILMAFIIFNFLIWNKYTKYTSPTQYGIGDLGRMSYQIDSFLPRKEQYTLPVDIFNYNDTISKKIDMITIGDSFSDGGGGGKNRFYQSYISFNNNITVLDIENLNGDFNYIESVIALNNNGFLNKLKPQYVLIESVEREVCNRFSRKINYDVNSNISDKELEKFTLFKKSFDTHNTSDNYVVETSKNSFFDYKNYNIKVVNNLNFNAFKYNFFYSFDKKAYSSSVYKFKLQKELFTSKDKKSLLVYKNDIKNLHLSTKENVLKVNNNLNKLAEILKRKNIKLVFMPVVDKYNLYSQYINNNDYPNSLFFELLRKEKKDYIFIDTKKILKRQLEKSVKDLYYSDDSHWSYKASEAIFTKVKFE